MGKFRKIDGKKIMWGVAFMILLAFAFSAAFDLTEGTDADGLPITEVEFNTDVAEWSYAVAQAAIIIIFATAALFVFITVVSGGKMTRNDYYTIMIIAVLGFFIWNGYGDIPGLSNFFNAGSWENITQSVLKKVIKIP